MIVALVQACHIMLSTRYELNQATYHQSPTCWFLIMVAGLSVKKHVVDTSKLGGGLKRLVIAHECVHDLKERLQHVFETLFITHMVR